MPRTFAIGDIHGCFKTFKKLLLDEINIQQSDEIFCLGDYIDRGDYSKQVVDLILALRSCNYKIHTLRGNHEQMLLDSNISDKHFELWIKNGGAYTLHSFGIKNINELSPEYLDFFNQTEFFIEKDNYLLVHAGFNLAMDDIFADKSAMLWLRDFAGHRKKQKGKTVIHGHDYVSVADIRSQSLRHSINVDSGCVYKDYPGYGHLCAFNLEERSWIMQRNIE